MVKYQVRFQDNEKAVIKEVEIEAAAYLVENGDLTFFSTVEGTTYSNRVASFRTWESVFAGTVVVRGEPRKRKWVGTTKTSG